MPALTMRRRWLIAKPWVRDFAIAIGFIIAVMVTMWGLGQLADVCMAMGWCA